MHRPFPKWLAYVGWLFVLPTLWLAGRLVWEQTVWTWRGGLQMVGFSLMHAEAGLALVLFGSLILGCVWLLLVLVFGVRCRSLGGYSTVAPVLLFLIAWGLIETPYGFWQRLFVGKLAAGNYPAQFTIDAAARGDITTLKAFLDQGVNIDAGDRMGATPLHGAAVAGQVDVARYLVERGANVNALNRSGDSPLEQAQSQKHEEVSRILIAHGGQQIRGSEEQHQKAVEEYVRETSR